MGVLDGEAVNQSITNPAFINKNQNDIMSNILGFNRALSGATVSDIQAAINKLYTATGASESATGTLYNASAGTIANGDSYQTALTILADKFDDITGHMHTGAPGDGPILDVVRTISAYTYTPLEGDVILQAGSGMIVSQSGQIIKFDATGSFDFALVNPTITKLTSGSGTYTTPTGVQYLQIRMVGGGGGGSGSSGSGFTNGGDGTDGGTTTFGTLTCNGGSKALGNGISGQAGNGGAASLGSGPIGTAVTGGAGAAGSQVFGNTTGTTYLRSTLGGVSPFGGNSPENANPAANTGNGGGGGEVLSAATATKLYQGNGGGAGGFIWAIITTPTVNQTFSYAVGTGGSGGAGGSGGGGGGGNGAAGYIEITEIYSAMGASTSVAVPANYFMAGPTSGANATPIFRAVVAADLPTGNLTDPGTDGITITGGSNAVIGSGTSIAQHVADSTHNGYLSSTDWTTFNSKQPAGNYITALTGDATASGPGSVTLTLATVNTNTGSFGSASNVAGFTVNGKGLITAAGTVSIQIAESQVTNLVSDLAGKQATGNYITALTGDGTASGPGSVAFTLATVNSTVGSFGSASSVATFTVNAKGLTTAAAAVSIQIAESQVTNLVSDLAGKQATGNYITALTGEVTASGPGSVAATVSNAAVIAKVLTGFTSGAGAVTASDSILSAFQKINGNDALKAPIASPTFTGTVNAASTILTANGSTLVLQNSSGGATATQLDISFKNSLGTEKGYLGFGSAADDIYVANNTSTGSFFLRTNGITALTVNSSQNSTFAGTLAVTGVVGTNTAGLTNTGNIFAGVATSVIGNYSAGRNFIAMQGNAGLGAICLGATLADADNTLVGSVEYFDANSSAVDKRLVIMVASTTGSTANNRGGTLDWRVKADGASGVVSRMTLSSTALTVGIAAALNGNVSNGAAVSNPGYDTSTATSGTITASANKSGLVINSAGGTTLIILLPSSPIDGQIYAVSSVGAFTTITWKDAGGTAGNVIGGQPALGGINRGQTFIYSTALTKWLATS